MRKVEHYICEVCGTEYKDKALCEKCERLHKQGLTIVRARFLPVTQDNTGMPVTIEVEGIEQCLITEFAQIAEAISTQERDATARIRKSKRWRKPLLRHSA